MGRSAVWARPTPPGAGTGCCRGIERAREVGGRGASSAVRSQQGPWPSSKAGRSKEQDPGQDIELGLSPEGGDNSWSKSE